jgi:heme exporter protein B
MTLIRRVLTVAAKDLRSEFRTKEALNASLSFAVLILLLVSFAFDPTADHTREIAGGLLWLVYAFAGALILNRSFAREQHNDCLDALVASPIPGHALFLGKAIGNVVLLMIVELICLPVFGIFFNVRWMGQFPKLLLVMILATWGITVIGTMFSALTVNLRLRELMMPAILYPIMVPCLMAAMELTTGLLAGQPIAALDAWFRMLVSFDIIFTLLGVVLIEPVLVG